MLVSEIKTEVRQIIQQLNPSNSNVSDTAILGWINACTLQLIANLVTLPKSTIAGVTATVADITLDEDMIKLDFVSLKDPQTGQHSPVETMDFVNFVRGYPNWEDQPATRPSKFIRMTDKTWKLWPSPDSYWVNCDMTLIGSVRPADLTLDSEQPPVSLAMHTIYPHYCAWKAFLLLNNPERAAAEYAIYDSLRKLNMQTTTSTTGSLLSLKMGGF